MTAPPPTTSLLDAVDAAIRRHAMLEPYQKVLVAFSGGADSTALALALGELGYPVVLGHVDHGLRAESADDALHCARVAGRLGLELLCRRVHVDPPTQAQARRVRYAALAEMARSCGAERIATGHTRDDQAETVALRLQRGGFGLGIPPVRDRIVRPLIGVGREQTETACARAGIGYLSDPFNEDPRYRRVAVRRELAGAGPEEVSRLLDIGTRSAEEAARVAAEVDQVWPDLVTAGAEEVRIGRPELARLRPAVARQLLHRAGTRLGLELGSSLVEDLLFKVLARTGARLDLSAGIAAWSEPDHLVLGRWAAEPERRAHRVEVGSRTVLADWGIELAAEVVPVCLDFEASPYRELVDGDAVGNALTVRRWRSGDRFTPLGAPGSKKLQDFFVDAKVPRRMRSEIPIVTAGDRIVWVVGYRLDSSARVTEHSRRAVRLSVQPIEQGSEV